MFMGMREFWGSEGMREAVYMFLYVNICLWGCVCVMA